MEATKRKQWTTVIGAAALGGGLTVIAQVWPPAFVPVLAILGAGTGIYFMVEMVKEWRERHRSTR